MTRATAVEDNVDEIKRRLTLPLDNLIKHHTIVVSQEKRKSVSITNDLIAGGIGGIAGIIVGHPFDSIKVRYQMAASTASSSSNAALKVQPTMNVSSLFRGIGAPVTTAALVNASVFMTYGESSRLWDRYINFDSTNVLPSKQFVCGAFTGFVSSFIVCPTEFLKIQMQTQNNASVTAYRSSLHAARSILSNYGIQGLYRGFISTCLRQSLGFSVYFASYDTIKDHLRYHLGSEHVWLSSILAGGISGSVSWSVVYPLDYIKSRIQAIPLSTTTTSELSILSVAKNTIQQQGWKSLYRGLGITVLRAFPVNGIIFPTYELCLSMLDSRSVLAEGKDVE